MPDAEITRAETRERARLLLVRSYDVDWDFTQGPGTDSADGSVHIYASQTVRFQWSQQRPTATPPNGRSAPACCRRLGTDEGCRWHADRG
jgi:hypothetical protein